MEIEPVRDIPQTCWWCEMKRQGVIRVVRIPPLHIMDTCTKVQRSSSNSCCDVSMWTEVVHGLNTLAILRMKTSASPKKPSNSYTFLFQIRHKFLSLCRSLLTFCPTACMLNCYCNVCNLTSTSFLFYVTVQTHTNNYSEFAFRVKGDMFGQIS